MGGVEIKDGVLNVDLLANDMGQPNWLTVKPILPPPAVRRQAKQALKEWTDGPHDIRTIAESLAAGEGQDGASLAAMVASMSKTASLPQRDRWMGHDASWQAWFGLGGLAGYNWAKAELAKSTAKPKVTKYTDWQEGWAALKKDGVGVGVAPADSGVGPTSSDVHVDVPLGSEDFSTGRKKKKQKAISVMLDPEVNKFNPNHEPAGSPSGGEFGSGEDGSTKFSEIGGIKYTLDPDYSGTVLVLADMDKLVAASQDVSNGLSPGAHHNLGQLQRVRSGIKNGVLLKAPQVTINPQGAALVEDGNHRLAVLRARGAKEIYISVPAANKAQAMRVVGLSEPTVKHYENFIPPQAVQANAARAVMLWKGDRQADEEVMLLASVLATGEPVGKDDLTAVRAYLEANAGMSDASQVPVWGKQWQEWMGLGGRAGLGWVRRVWRKEFEKTNPYHEPAGSSSGGQFTSAPGGGSMNPASTRNRLTGGEGRSVLGDLLKPPTGKLPQILSSTPKYKLNHGNPERLASLHSLEVKSIVAQGAVAQNRSDASSHIKSLEADIHDYVTRWGASPMALNRLSTATGFLTDIKDSFRLSIALAGLNTVVNWLHKDELTKLEIVKFSLGSVQLNIDSPPVLRAIAKIQDSIDPAHLMGNGLESEPHVTIRYGFTDGTDPIEHYLRAQQPVTLQFGRTFAFDPTESSDDASVIYVALDAPALTQMNRQLKGIGEWRPANFPYKPHLTIAYVDPEFASRYVGLDNLEGLKQESNHAVISTADGQQTIVPLTGVEKGGTGSGDRGHAGRPGEVGGSGSGGAASSDLLKAQNLVRDAGIHVESWGSLPQRVRDGSTNLGRITNPRTDSKDTLTMARGLVAAYDQLPKDFAAQLKRDVPVVFADSSTTSTLMATVILPAAGTTLLVNTGYLDDRAPDEKNIIYADRAAKTPEDTFKIAALHEFGHILNAQTNNGLVNAVVMASPTDEGEGKWQQWTKFLEKNVSKYATTSANETAAELTAMHFNEGRAKGGHLPAAFSSVENFLLEHAKSRTVKSYTFLIDTGPVKPAHNFDEWTKRKSDVVEKQAPPDDEGDIEDVTDQHDGEAFQIFWDGPTEVQKFNPHHEPAGSSTGGQFANSDAFGDLPPKDQSSILWALHPQHGVIFDTRNLSPGFRTHASWFRKIGLPDTGVAFDRVQRGRILIDTKGQQVTIQAYAEKTPLDVEAKLFRGRPELKNYRIISQEGLGKFNPNHDERGRFSSGEGGGSPLAYEFISPNTKENLTFKDAVAALHSPRQKQFLDLSHAVDGQLGLSAHAHNAIGDWKDGAENTIFNEITSKVDYQMVLYTSAIKGLAAEQKAVIPFQVVANGMDSLYRIPLQGSVDTIRQKLDAAGVEFRTLVPHGSTTDVIVFDPGTQMRGTIQALAKSEGVKAQQYRGKGEFLGGDTRQAGASKFQNVIASFEHSHPNLAYHPSRGLKAARSDDMNFKLTADITKMDEDQHLAFGWASIATENGEPLLDLQGDMLTDAELEKAAYNYVLDSRTGGEMHLRYNEAPKEVGRLVESIVLTADKQKALGIDLGKTGWWVGFKIADDAVWKKVKDGTYKAFSIHGHGIRERMAT